MNFYACIFCDFHTFVKSEHDHHLVSDHSREIEINHIELLKLLTITLSNNHQGIESLMGVEEFFSDNLGLSLEEHSLAESPCREMICKPSIFSPMHTL